MSKIIASVSLIWTKIKVIPIKYWFTLFFIIFTLVFGLLEWQQRLRLHPDEISYIEIAQAYKNGNFYEALNAYWNPAFSWLLIPISYITIWPYTGKILNTILISSLFASTFVFSQYIFHNKYKSLLSAILTTLLPGEFIYAWLYVTPDLLLTLFCLWYLFCFFELSKTNSTKNWLFIGILTSIGYLIKNIFLPVVLLFYLLFFLTLQKKVVIKNITSLFIGIVIIASFWSSLLYIKYHKLTLGTSGIVNYYQYVILDKKFDFFNKPSEYHDYGTSYWRDPSSFPKISFNLEKQIEIVYKNTKELLRILIWNINIGWFFILIFIFKSKKTLNQKTIVIFILSWYILYIPILIVPRYIWPTIPLLFILIVGTYNTRLRIFF